MLNVIKRVTGFASLLLLTLTLALPAYAAEKVNDSPAASDAASRAAAETLQDAQKAMQAAGGVNNDGNAIPKITGIRRVYTLPTAQGLVYLASQPSRESFAHLQKMGVKTVVNLRQTWEMPFDEASIVKRLKMRYLHLPINSDTLSLADVKKFNRLLKNGANYPLFIHCSSANRSAALVALVAMLNQQMESKAAIARSEKLGLTSPLLKEKIKELGRQMQLLTQ